MWTRAAALAAVVWATAFAPASAWAAGPLDGRSASAPGTCALPDDSPDVAATIRDRRFDQYEAHCRWGPMSSAAVGVWRARGLCSVQGDETRGAFRFTRRGDRLWMRTPDGVTSAYRRCPAG
ncbi:hypothetical protein BH09PSE2_BH09PSE2_10060 [soil metagenome]